MKRGALFQPSSKQVSRKMWFAGSEGANRCGVLAGTGGRSYIVKNRLTGRLLSGRKPTKAPWKAVWLSQRTSYRRVWEESNPRYLQSAQWTAALILTQLTAPWPTLDPRFMLTDGNLPWGSCVITVAGVGPRTVFLNRSQCIRSFIWNYIIKTKVLMI